MNTGLLSSRYASALISLVTETGNGDEVLSQAKRILSALDSLPDFRRLVSDDVAVKVFEKLSFFRSALDGEAPAPELERFVLLMTRNGRMGEFRRFLRKFVTSYSHFLGFRNGRLILAAPSEVLQERLRGVLEEATGWKIHLETVVDPGLIGGFVLELEDFRSDASVTGKLEKIRSEFLERNKRLEL